MFREMLGIKISFPFTVPANILSYTPIFPVTTYQLILPAQHSLTNLQKGKENRKNNRNGNTSQ